MWRTESEEPRFQVRLQAYRFELRPDRKQRHQMRRFAGSCRFVFPRALGLQKELFELSGAHASYADLCAVLVDWKQDKETEWLNEAPSQVLQQSLKNLDAAWARRLDSLQKAETGPNQSRPTDRRACLQEEGKARQLSLSAGDLSGTKQQPHLASQAWLDAISQQPGSAGCGQERHGEPGGWQMDGFDSDRA